MFVPVQLDKVRNFRYGMRALKTVEDLEGKSISQIDMENMSMSTLANLVYAGLCHEDKELTIDKVIDLIDDYSDIQSIAETMGKAIALAFNKDNQRKNSQRVAAKK